MPVLFETAGAGAFSTARADNIPPGKNLFVKVGTDSYSPLAETPVPPNFFFPGSPALNANVHVQSVPLGMLNGFYVGATDPVIVQLEEANLDGREVPTPWRCNSRRSRWAGFPSQVKKIIRRDAGKDYRTSRLTAGFTLPPRVVGRQ